MSTLQARLNDPEYRHWVKAGLCLSYIKEGMEDFVHTTSQQLHQNVFDNLTKSAITNTGQPVCGAKIKGQVLVNVCQHPYCTGFLNAVKQEGLDPNQPFTFNYGNLKNTDVRFWHSDPYELAKLFMNSGQTATQKTPAQTDLSGLLNFIDHCKVPCSQISTTNLIKKVRSARNDIMHNSAFKVTETDFKTYSQSMISLLNDVNISASPTAKNAVVQIQRVMNAADFTITLEDEAKVMNSLKDELHTMALEIKQEFADMKKGVERENCEIRRDIKHGKEEMIKIKSLYDTLQQRVKKTCDLRDHIGNEPKKLDELLNETIREHQERLVHIEQQQRQTNEVVDNLEAQQKQTNDEIENIKAEQRKLDEAINSRNKAEQTWSPSEEEKSQLQQNLIDGYKQKLKVFLSPEWVQLPVSEIFTPSILVCDEENKTHKKEEFRNLETYRQLFYKNDVLQKRVILLGEAGTGKTTFSKHLTDAWCKTTTKRQFDDVDVLKEFHYLFYVSCRFAEEKETLLDMINNQLFDDENMKEVAIYVLKHYPACCLIVLDGADEWKGSPTSETGRRGDITGLPGMIGVEGCVILITSRPWRFHTLPKKTKDIFRRLQINGVKDVKQLAFRILQKLEDPDPKQSTRDFMRQMKGKNMLELMEIPLILIIMLGGWIDDKSLHRSNTINYIYMIMSFIRRSKGQCGWSKGKLQQLSSKLDNLESEWERQVHELPESLLANKPLKRYAGLFLSLGQLAFNLLLEKEEKSLVFSKPMFQSYLSADEENDESVNCCLALGILSKTETTTCRIKKLESYAFCHKTFKEFFAALWLTSKYSNEKSKLYKCIKSYSDLMSYEILIRFLCGLDPAAGKLFWKFIAEEDQVMGKEEQESWYTYSERMKNMQDLVCKCMKEHGCDPKYQKSDQIYFCIPHIEIDEETSDENMILLRNVMEKYPDNVKSLVLNSVSMTNLLLPVEGTRMTLLRLVDVTMTHHGCEQLAGALLSYSSLENLDLRRVRCRDHDGGCCIPVLDLQKHNKLKRPELYSLSVAGLLLPVEGTGMTLRLWDVTMTHHGCEQLAKSLLSFSESKKRHLFNIHVKCSKHSDSTCQTVEDVNKL